MKRGNAQKLMVKVPLVVFSLLLFFSFTHSVHATTKFWIGSSGGSFASNSNWSLSNGGANNTTAPGSSDVATFTSSANTNCAIDSTISVSGININTGYTATITQSAGVDVTVGSGNFVEADGAFTGSSGLITVTGTFTLSGGTFTASTATTTFKNTFTRTSGTYTHNSGITSFDPSVVDFTVAANGATFNNVAMIVSALGTSATLTITQNFTTAGYLQIYNNSSSFNFSIVSSGSINPTITVQGNLDVPNAASTNAASGLKIGSATAANNFTINLAGNVSMVESAMAYYLTTVFNGTGTQTITKTAGNIFSASSWSSTKASGTLTISSYGYTTLSTDLVTWTAGDLIVSSAQTMGAFTLSGGTFTAGTTLTFDGAFTLSSGTFTAGSATTTFKNTFTRTSGTYTHNSGITAFDPSVTDFTVAANGATFNNVAMIVSSLGASATLTITQSFTAAGYLQLYNNSASFNFAVVSQSSLNPTITVQGNLDIPNAASTNVALGLKIGSATAANNFTINIAGNVSMVESAMAYYATTVFNGTGAQTISKTAGNIFSASSWSSTKASGTLTVTSYGYSTLSTDLVTWSSGDLLISSGVTMGGFTLSGGTFTAGSLLTFDGAFSLSSGTFTAGSATTTFKNTFTRTSGTYTHNSGITAFDPSVTDFTVAANGATFNNVVILVSSLGTNAILTISQNFSAAGYLQMYNNSASFNLTVQGSSNVFPILTVTGNIDMPNAASTNAALGLKIGSATAANNFAINTAGNMSMAESAVAYYATTTFSGSGTQTVSITAGTIQSASTWVINKSAGKVSLSTTLAHPSTVTLSAGTLDINGNTFTAATAFNLQAGGTFILQGGETITSPTFGAGSTTVMYNGASSYASLKAGNTYYHLAFNGSGTWTLNSALDVNANLSIMQGTLSAAGFSINLAGNLFNSGTYTHGNNTFTFDGGSQSISGSSGTTFYNFSKATSTVDTFIFPSNVTTTISNNTVLNGISGARLLVRSDTSGSQSNVNFSNSGSRTIQYVDVKDNNNTNATAVLCTTGCTNSLNNTNWTFQTELVVTTQAASSITQTTATLNGNITATGGEDATQHGFAYGTSATLATTIATTTLGSQSGTGAFTGSVSSLTCNTTYYFRPYATNSAGTAYGSITSFTTSACSPTVTTQAASSITQTTATLNGNITATGGADATEHGFAYGTSATLATTIATTTLGSQSGTGAFTSSVSSLTCNTTYYFRPYATNSGGTSYGSITSFVAGACAPTVSTTLAVASITVNSATIGASVDDTGGEDGTQHGFAYGTVANLSTVISTSTLGAYTGTGSFTGDLSGLTCATLYYFRGYATDSGGTGLGSIKSFTTSDCPVSTSSGSTNATSTTSVSTGSRSGGKALGITNNNKPKNPNNPNNPNATSSNPKVTTPPVITSLPNTLVTIKTPSSKPLPTVEVPTVISTTSSTSTNSSGGIDVGGIANFIRTIFGYALSGTTFLASILGSFVKAIARSASGKLVMNTIVTGGAIMGIVVGSSRSYSGTFSVSDYLLATSRLWGAILTTLGFRKKSSPWGVVYDSASMQPLDPAIVTVYDKNGREVATAITDIDGRYGFLLEPGIYTLTAGKSHYAFPSRRLAGKKTDGFRDNLYFGSQVTVSQSGDVVKLNIPMDPVGFDWNEFIKKEEKLTSFYNRHDRLIARVSKILFIAGFVLSIVGFILNPNIPNIIIFIIYLLSSILVLTGKNSRAHGTVIDKRTGQPLSFARVHVYLEDKKTEINKKVCDSLGRYFCLVPNGNYYIKIEEKNDDDSYSEVYFSDIIKVKNGIIRKNFDL